MELQTQLAPKASHKVLPMPLREALTVLEMPLPDLRDWLHEQITRNPALQWGSDPLVIYSDTLEEGIANPPSLRDHLLAQAREMLQSPKELVAMEQLIGNLDPRGQLDPRDATDTYLVHLLQSMDPPGVGALSLQQSLLIQLERQGKCSSAAYEIVDRYYQELLLSCWHKIPFNRTTIDEALRVLSQLSLNPIASFATASVSPHVPDILIMPSSEGWIVQHHDAFLPPLECTLTGSPELSSWEQRGEWISTMVSRRIAILVAITQTLIGLHAPFFEGEGGLKEPLTLCSVAQTLSLHPSTMSRAVQNKYLSCPRGIFPFSHFFSPALHPGGPSQHAVKQQILTLIRSESSEEPLSDAELVHALRHHGMFPSRRTVTKYRRALGIPSAAKRGRR